MGMDKYNSQKKNISVNRIAIGEKFVNKKEKIENNFLFVSDQ